MNTDVSAGRWAVDGEGGGGMAAGGGGWVRRVHSVRAHPSSSWRRVD